MPIKYVTQIPKARKVSKFDQIIEEAIKMIYKDPTKMVEITEEGGGLVMRFKRFQEEGKFPEMHILRRGRAVYISSIG